MSRACRAYAAHAGLVVVTVPYCEIASVAGVEQRLDVFAADVRAVGEVISARSA